LAFGRPRNKVVTKENAKPGRGATGIWTSSPIGVGVGNKRGNRRRRNVSAKVKSTFDVSDDALN
jgi:hypothetical protein